MLTLNNLSECTHKPPIVIKGNLFDVQCKNCGWLISFADDSSLVVKSRCGNYLVTSERLDQLLTKLKEFLRLNSFQFKLEKHNYFA